MRVQGMMGAWRTEAGGAEPHRTERWMGDWRDEESGGGCIAWGWGPGGVVRLRCGSWVGFGSYGRGADK